MMQRGHPCQERIGANAFGGKFRKVGNLQAVLIRAWRGAQDVAQQRVIGPRQLDELQT